MRRMIVMLGVAGIACAAQAQVVSTTGTPANPLFLLDFDNPFVGSGPIAGNAAPMTSHGIRNISLVGSWSTLGDIISPSANASGQSLVSTFGGRLAVAGVGGALDNPGAGAGFEITLFAATPEFGVLFVDQTNMDYDIELFSGVISLGVGNFNYTGGFPNPPRFWSEFSGRTFDRILITFPTGAGGVGIDNIVMAVPTPGVLALLGLGGLVAVRRRR